MPKIAGPPSFYLLSLGCSKNQVDSEGMLGLLQDAGFRLTEEPAQAAIIIINTCGFIQAAQQESIDAVLAAARYKHEGNCRLLVMVGCLVEKFRGELEKALPEVDIFLGSGAYGQIAAVISSALGLPPHIVVAEQALSRYRRRLGPGHTAYLKIAEGCDKHCTYCLIPQLRGPYRSRPMAAILAEASQLAAEGVHELILLAQDSSAYGLDLNGQRQLPQLLEQLATLPFRWIRILYAYPEGIDEPLLKVMASHDNLCPYLDLPCQHSDDAVLRAMGRKTSQAELKAKLQLIRHYLPDAALRTTMMVGFPGETAAAFNGLLEFVAAARFDWLGAFAYSREADTPAYRLPRQVPAKTKQQRLDRLLQVAAQATAERQQRFLNRTLSVLVEEPASAEYGPGWWRGRSAYQAPEVDGCVYFRAADPMPGQFGQVKITAADVFDLRGEWLG